MRFFGQLNLFLCLQMVADFITMFFSFLTGYWVYIVLLKGSVTYDIGSYAWLSLFSSVLFQIAMFSGRLYEREMSLLNLSETRRLLWSWIIGSMFTFGLSFYFRIWDLSRLMVTFSLVAVLISLFIERRLFYHLHLYLISRGWGKNRVIIYGAGHVGRHLLKRIYHSPGLGLVPVGFLDDDEKIWGKEIFIRECNGRRKVLGGLNHIEEIVTQDGVKEVFVALPNASYNRNLEIVRKCRSLGIAVSVVPPSYDHQVYHIDVEDLGGIPILREKSYSPSYIYLFFKRLFDLAFSAFIMIVFSPIFLLLALAVKMDSKGPIFFRQKRVGQFGREFEFYKFRTMHVDTPTYAVAPDNHQDKRITSLGKWLRRSSLDELPQFINVLKGDMSVVGPRPEMPFIVSSYNDLQKERLRTRPGITGIWQISAVRGEPIHANIEYDLFYIENQSLLLDFIIVLRTILGAIRGVGAF